MSELELYQELKKKVDSHNTRTAVAKSKYVTAKENLTEVVEKIREAGYSDPKKLPEILAEKKEEFAKKAKELSEALDAQEKILDAIEE